MMATTTTCVSKEKIERACYSVALSLGYSSLKDKQRLRNIVAVATTNAIRRHLRVTKTGN